MRKSIGQIILFAISVFVLLSCQSAPKKKEALKPAPPDTQSLLQSAQSDLNRGRARTAMNKLKKIATQSPGTDASDTAWSLMGRYYLQHKDYKSASSAYLQVLNATTETAHEEEAYLGASRSLTQVGRVDEALALCQKALASGHLSSGARIEIQQLEYPLLKETGDSLGALKALAAVHDAETDPAKKEALKDKAFDIANKLKMSDLEAVVDNAGFTFIRGFAAYRLGTYYLEQHDFDKARSLFEKTTAYTPNTNIATAAANHIAQIDGRRIVDPNTIGVVLPLTGRYESIAQKSMRGLQLGLGIYGTNRSSFKLAIVDSQGSPEEAKKGVENLVGENHVIAIVGSLLSKTSIAVATKANELGVPSIALSQKAGLTEIGSMVFRNAITSSMQVQFLVKTAMEQEGMKRFAILFPNDAYGVEYANLFWDEVVKRGGKIVGAQPYNPTETDFRAPVKRLVGTYYVEDRQTEYRNRLKDWFKDQKNPRSGRNTPPDDLLPPITDFDAIFVPDSPKAMGQIAPMLAYVGVGNVRFLGTNLWNTPEFLRRGDKRVEKALFVDTEITTDPRFANSKFYNDFKKAFGSEPGQFELQGYETGLLLSHAINDGERSRIGLAERLTKTENVQGVLGPMQMSPERELIWPMTAFTVENQQIVPLTKNRQASSNEL